MQCCSANKLLQLRPTISFVSLYQEEGKKAIESVRQKVTLCFCKLQPPSSSLPSTRPPLKTNIISPTLSLFCLRLFVIQLLIFIGKKNVVVVVCFSLKIYLLLICSAVLRQWIFLTKYGTQFIAIRNLCDS